MNRISNNITEVMEQKSETVTGIIHKIVFQSQDTGFTVARLKVKNQSDPVTIVGKIAGLDEGKTVELSGKWITHKKFGRQLQVETFLELKPGTLLGIEKYLGSGIVPGIGPKFARRIVQKFGLETLDVIENNPELIREVEGIGKKRAGQILKSWNSQKNLRNTMIFLQGHGIGPARATRIFKKYGENTIGLVQENPYRLAEDIWGIGFKVADEIAGNLGIDKNSSQRAGAAIKFALTQAAEDGHCFLELNQLLEICHSSLNVPYPVLLPQLDNLITENKLIFDEDSVYLKRYYYSEKKSAEALSAIMNAPSDQYRADPDSAVKWVQNAIGMKLSQSQKEAVKMALKNKVTVITGGPGVGKTTILKALVTILRKAGYAVSLCAPTGRAAKRMAEAVGIEAKTIHRLLKYKPMENKFEYDGSCQLNTDCVIVDEMSMVDITLFYNLLVAIPPKAKVVMVGDVDQLPSVGAGMVLKDLIESGVIPTSNLTEIFRQKQDSLIIKNSHLINKGEFPIIPSYSSGKLLDFYFILSEDPEKIGELIMKTVTERIPRRFGLDPIGDIQVISPMAKRVLGAKILNEQLQEAQNKNPVLISTLGRDFRIDDKVMQIRNNYELEVYNGDIGRIQEINAKTETLTVNFDGRPVEYDLSKIDELVLAYACTVHKSQGSEFPAVVMPLYTGHYILLQRNLLYTAITRAKKLVVLVGSRKALGIAISNNKVVERNSRLRFRLKEMETQKEQNV